MLHEVTIENTADVRADVYLSSLFSEYSRSFLKNLFDGGRICVNGRAVKSGAKLKAGDTVTLDVPEPQAPEAAPQDIPLDIVYEDADVAVINKPRGMVVHPAAGNADGTLVNALLYRISGLSGINGVLRPGIVHRLDKDTSGLIAIAKNDAAHKSLAEQLKSKQMYRVYLAIVHGNIREDDGVVDAPIGRSRADRKKNAVVPDGRPAVTHYRVLERFRDYTLVECRLETGRTHQIRVHMKHIGHPVAGDAVYGPRDVKLSKNGQLLFAQKLGFTHPVTGEAMLLEAPVPQDMAAVLERLRAGIR